MTRWHGQPQGYRPTPQHVAQRGFWHVLAMLTMTSLGLSGIIWLALGWASILIGR